MPGPEFAQTLFYLMPEKTQFSLYSNNFSLNLFVAYMKPVLQVLAKVLGKEDTAMVENLVLGMFSLMMKAGVVLYILYYLEDVVNTHFMNLSLTSCFRFPSLVTYLFLYSHVESFT